MILRTSCALYVHIPFCRSKCLYCDFNSCAGAEAMLPAYLDALAEEMSRAGALRLQGQTLYLGGGTPSLLSPGQVRRVVNQARAVFSLPTEAEVTLEANPGTVDAEYLAAVHAAGVNRLSLGVQSFASRALRFLGRIHTADQAEAAYQSAREAGFQNIGLDLIYALPGQSEADWEGDLARAVALAPEHLSLYGLSVEEGTPLARLVEEGKIVPASADEAAALYELAEEMLDRAGYEHYEISNWARLAADGSSRRSRHNLAYWSDEPYLGFGAGAHSYFGGRRFWNEADPATYIARVRGEGRAEAGDEMIGPRQGLQDALMMGLRVREGVDLAALGRRYGLDVASCCATELAELSDLRLIGLSGSRLALTRRGRLLANAVLVRLLAGVQAG